MKSAALILVVLLAGCDEASPKAGASVTAIFPDTLTSPLANVVSNEKKTDIAKVLAERDVCRSGESEGYKQSNWLIVSNR